MGQNKALMEIDGRAMALRIADVAAPVFGTVSVVGELSEYGNLRLPVLPDRFPGLGPVAGIEAALHASAAELNCCIACDMPSITSTLLESLAGAVEADCDCVIPRYADGRREPLCAIYRRSCHPVILAALQSGTRKVMNLLDLLRVKYVPIGEPGCFANLNTPEEWRSYTHG